MGLKRVLISLVFLAYRVNKMSQSRQIALCLNQMQQHFQTATPNYEKEIFHHQAQELTKDAYRNDWAYQLNPASTWSWNLIQSWATFWHPPFQMLKVKKLMGHILIFKSLFLCTLSPIWRSSWDDALLKDNILTNVRSGVAPRGPIFRCRWRMPRSWVGKKGQLTRVFWRDIITSNNSKNRHLIKN